MNTELRLNHTRTGSNKHGKSAKDISFTDLLKILTCQKQHQEALFRASKQHATGTYHSKKKAWNYSTKCIDQKSLTDYEPKRYRRYDGTRVNMQVLLTVSDLAEN